MSDVTGPQPPRRRSRLAGMRGATLVEYALIFVALTVVTVGVASYLLTQARGENANQIDCIKTRPPPTTCQFKSATTTTSTAPPGTGGPPPPPPTTAPPASYQSRVASVTHTESGVAGSPWTLNLTPLIELNTDPDGAAGPQPYGGYQPLADATVQIRVSWTSPSAGSQGPLQCRTAANGTCTLQFSVPANVTVATVTVVSVDAYPGPSPTLPSPSTVNRPY